MHSNYFLASISKGDSYCGGAPPLSQPPCLKAIPLRYTSPDEYLRGMQLHSSAEYYAAVQVLSVFGMVRGAM